MHAFISSGIRAFAEGEHHDITQTPSKFWPEPYEILYGGIASVLIFSLLIWKVGPLAKKAMAARTAKIQAEIDAGESDRTSAQAEAAQIRAAKGDIAAERARILAEADVQAAAVREDGASRLAAEVADLEARAEADIAASAGRVGAELRAEIARLSSAAVDHVVTGSLDDATQQELIESFITRVGASA
jgi:F-type H+-transporting ATPase subunit b